MVEIFGTSVRIGIAHKVILASQFVRTGIVPRSRYARVLVRVDDLELESGRDLLVI
jgi:hypothetical protein